MSDVNNALDLFDSLGISVESNKSVMNKIKKDAEANNIVLDNPMESIREKRESQSLFCTLTDSDRDQAVKEFIIPSSYRNAYFDYEKVRSNIKNQYKASKNLYKVYNLNTYVQLCNTILSTLRMGNLPDRSYIIGAPNGFGKTSFVNESLITLRKRGYRAVPYISLIELAGLRVAEEQRLMKPYNKFKADTATDSVYYTEFKENDVYVKKPLLIQNKYSFSEYINADCLFVSFSDVVSKDIESHMLYQLLSIRGPKGLPTIAMISTSLAPYENDQFLKEYVWDEIRAYKETAGCYDRVYHVSCYKRKELNMAARTEGFENDTGIVS